MRLYTVWKKRFDFSREGQLVNEKCLLRSDGNYVGVDSGTVYLADNHYHSPQLTAHIVAVDEVNQTGMYHLCAEWRNDGEENRKSWKERYVGCAVTLEVQFNLGDTVVYRCLELGDYWSSNEVELLEK